jgi:radical SAM protein with 4Fe4S-binding SPASM domain
VAYEYGAKEPEKLKIKDMTPREKELLIESDSFCMLPWMHLHAFPDGRAYPCCFAFDKLHVGNVNEQSMEEVFNGDKMKQMRLNMLNNKKSRECVKCYDQEDSGFFSLRLSSNKHFGHNISMTENTKPDGTADFMIKYWDIRFSNLCNMACRSCGTWFSSNWYEDHKKLTGAPPNHAKIMKAGRSSNDIWDQLLKQFDHVEQFYFAGGEPIIMEEHLRILKELDKRKMYHVRLIYNTNFSKSKFKGTDIFELWNKFDSVSIGASLDAEGPRAELMRKGTVWEETVANRKRMLEVCPQVDFYISATVGLSNCLHVLDFHKSWVEKGFIKPQDFNFNLLQYPLWQRMDLLPQNEKEKVTAKYKEHIEWLKSQDHLTRASKGFESALDWMNKKDMSKHMPTFVNETRKYDKIRDENFTDVFPEWKDLFDRYETN